MNTKKLLIVFIVVFILLEVSNYLIHSVILDSTYASAEVSKVFRPMEEMNSKMWIMWVIDLVWSFFFVFIFAKGNENKGLLEGVRYGIYMGFFVQLVVAHAQFTVYPLPYSLVFQWFIFGFIQCVILGFSTALIYNTLIQITAKGIAMIPLKGKENLDISTNLSKGLTNKTVFGIICFLMGLIIYLWASAHSPNMSFGEMLTKLDSYIIKEPLYSFIIVVAAALGLIGIIIILKEIVTPSKK